MPQQNDDIEEKDFADLIKEFAHGSTNKMAAQRIREIVQACRETGKKGAIKLTIGISVQTGIVEVKAAISTTKPEHALPGACYYATDEGGLVDEDPRQLKLNTKIIDAPAQLKTINGGNNP
jgi:hypothetical protein